MEYVTYLVARHDRLLARTFCATYFGGELLAPVVYTVTETTHTTSRKKMVAKKGAGGGVSAHPLPPLNPPLSRAALSWAETHSRADE